MSSTEHSSLGNWVDHQHMHEQRGLCSSNTRIIDSKRLTKRPRDTTNTKVSTPSRPMKSTKKGNPLNQKTRSVGPLSNVLSTDCRCRNINRFRIPNTRWPRQKKPGPEPHEPVLLLLLCGGWCWVWFGCLVVWLVGRSVIHRNEAPQPYRSTRRYKDDPRFGLLAFRHRFVLDRAASGCPWAEDPRNMCLTPENCLGQLFLPSSSSFVSQVAHHKN